MIYVAMIIYMLFGLGYALGKRKLGATVIGAFVVGIFWPFWLGYDLGQKKD